MGDARAEVEIWRESGSSVVALAGDRVTLGKADENGIALEGDPTVSRLHAVLERFDAGWSVSDLGSHNGTFVNGERIWSSQRLRHGDELRVGNTRLQFRDSSDVGVTATAAAEGPAPSLTDGERDVLTVLCRPLLDRDLFTDPASAKDIAGELRMSEVAVKLHLENLYSKFGVHDTAQHRPSRLASEAIRRAAVTLSQLRHPEA